ncbi:MAG: hypothetical protein JNM09_25405 [Blastocatellia bacterium]|nr:hypothetical protein [Blastocatellia bacterium]
MRYKQFDMSVYQIRIVIILIVSLHIAVTAQRRVENCQINAHWDDPVLKIGSGHMILGYFSAPVGADNTIKSFGIYDTGLIVTAAIRFEWKKFGAKGFPHFVSSGVTIASKEAPDLFQDESVAIATTPYSGKWKGLTVTKKLWFEKRFYTFNLECGGFKTIPVRPQKKTTELILR